MLRGSPKKLPPHALHEIPVSDRNPRHTELPSATYPVPPPLFSDIRTFFPSDSVQHLCDDILRPRKEATNDCSSAQKPLRWSWHHPKRLEVRIMRHFMIFTENDVGVKSPRLWYLRIVTHYVLPQSYPTFAYRGAYAPLLCSYWGGSQGHSTTRVRAHVVSDLLTLVSLF